MTCNPTRNKEILINKWTESIHKLEHQIKLIQKDPELSVAERQKKIAKRQEIIENYKFSIRQAREFLDRESAKSRFLYNKYSKTK